MSYVCPCFNNTRLLTSVIILYVLICSPLLAEEIDIQVIGTYKGSFQAGEVAVRNGYAFIAGGKSVEIIKVTNPNAPQFVTRISTSALGLAIKDNYLYVVGNYGFEVYNITNSSSPAFVTARDTGRQDEATSAWATQVRIEGDYAYVVYEYSYYDEEEWFDLDWGGLEVFDISNPSQPTFRGYYGERPYDYGDWAPFYWGRIDVKQAYVYMENSDGDIEVIDATNPDYPYQCQNYPWMGSGNGNFYISGDVAFYSGGLGTTAYDVTDPGNPVQTGLQIYTSGAICAQGEQLYLQTIYNKPNFITCFDVSDHDWPKVLGSYPLTSPGHYSQKIVLQGDRLFSLLPNELSILDVATPASLQTISGDEPYSGCNAVAVQDNLAWTVGSGLTAYDVSIPAEPWGIGSYAANAMARSVARYGSYALVAKGEGGLQILDVSNPENPTPVSRFESQAYMHQVTVSGTKAYIADNGGGAHIIDLADPLRPQHLSTCLPEGNVSQIAVSGRLAFLCATSGPIGGPGMYIYDVEYPSEPVLLSVWNQNQGVRCVALQGDYAFAAGRAGIDIIDVSAPKAPVLVGHYHHSYDFHALAVEGTYLYALTSVNLYVVDITNPASPTEISKVWPGHLSGGMAVAGSLVYATSGSSGVKIISVADKADPVVVGTCDTNDIALDIIPVGTDLWVANGRGGLLVLDASNTTAIQPRGAYDDSGEAMDVALKEGYAFVAARETGLHIVDIANPQTIALTKRYLRAARYDTAGDAQAVAVSGDYVYIADGTNGLVVLYVHDPEHPVLAGSLDTAGNAMDVAVLGQSAYIADGEGGLQVVSISTPGNPVLSGTYKTAGTAQGVAVAGGHAFVADGANGLVVVDVQNPAFPRYIGDLALTGDACAIAMDGSTAYVAALHGGVHAVNISTLTAPRRVGGNGIYKARGVTVSDHYVYVTGASSMNEYQLAGFVVLYPQ